MKIVGHKRARQYMGVGEGKVVEIIPAYHAKQEWISVKDEVPELGRRILICGKNGGINIATRHFEGVDNEAQVSCSSAQRRFTHWMPLPEPPERDGE